MTKKVKNSTKYIKCLRTLLNAHQDGGRLDYCALLTDIKSIAEEYCIEKHNATIDLLIETSLLLLFGCKLYVLAKLARDRATNQLSAASKERFGARATLFEAAAHEYLEMIEALTNE